VTGGLRYEALSVNGRDEWLTVVGADEAPALLILPPLFEELNRTRALLLQTMRALAAAGWRCVLPDLPGTGESETALEAVEWRHWRDAATAAAAAVGAVAALGIRGGALLDDVVPRRWRLSPPTGAALVRDLERTGLTGARGGGYAPAPALVEALRAAAAAAGPAAGEVRTARLASDPAPADVRLEGPPLWRRSEPAGAPALAAAIAADVSAWIGRCAAS
jgi:pimeloyl-ACP methyl ester carboxylesterase